MMLGVRNWRSLLPYSGLLLFPVMAAMYEYFNKPGEKVYSLVTDLDQATPFLPVFAVPYLLWIFYIIGCLIWFHRKDPRAYYMGLFSYVVCALICYTVYVYFQTTVPRPVVEGEGLLSDLMRYLYARDEPYNCFPSIHCFSSYLMMKVLYKSGFRTVFNQAVIYISSATIMLSTLLVKQHVILDLLSAMLLVEVVYAAISRLHPWVSALFAKKRLLPEMQNR